MKIKTVISKNYIDIISYLFIILFSYAAFSKLLDYESFIIQLGQSPLLSAFAGRVSWFIPSLELLIATLLMFKRTRFLTLVASFALMVMFSAYIFIILHYSEFVPCLAIIAKNLSLKIIELHCHPEYSLQLNRE